MLFTKTVRRVAIALAFIAAVVVLVNLPSPQKPSESVSSPRSTQIPNPFSSVLPSALLRGSLLQTGTQGGRDFYDVSFTEAETTETLPGSSIFSIIVPNSQTISGGAPLRAVFSGDTKFYAYEYSDIDATAEFAGAAAAALALAQGENVPFVDLFPHKFFASDAMMSDPQGSAFLATFEQSRSDIPANKIMRFLPLEDLTFHRNSRLIIVTLDAGTILTVRWCGDDIIQPPEACDDGNGTGGDLCSASCTCDHRAKLLELIDEDENGLLSAMEVEHLLLIVDEWQSAETPDPSIIIDANCDGAKNDADAELLLDIALILSE